MIASWISSLASGSPRTRLKPTASTRYSARSTRTSWPLLISGTSTRRNPRNTRRVAQVGEDPRRLGPDLHVDRRERVRIRDQPRFGAIGEESVAQHQDRDH